MKLSNCEKVCNDLRTQLAVLNAKIEEKNNHLSVLKTQLSEKNNQLLYKDNELSELRKRPAAASQSEQQQLHDNTEMLALKVSYLLLTHVSFLNLNNNLLLIK